MDMSRKQLKRTLLMGPAAPCFCWRGIVYSLLYNDGRWVREMDLEEHVFSCKEHPHAGGGHAGRALCRIYRGGYLPESPQGPFSHKKSLHQNYTRRVPPFLGVFGIFGLLGLSGFWTCHAHGIVSPFLLFALFGLFGLFLRESFSHSLRTSCFSRRQGQT